MTAGDIATIVLASCAVIGGTVEFTIRGHRFFRRRRWFWDAMVGTVGDEARGIPAVPSIIERVQVIDRRTQQLEPNGGETLVDKVNDFGVALDAHAKLDEGRHQDVLRLLRAKT